MKSSIPSGQGDLLYIHMAALGDGLMASPALALLKQALPSRRLVVLSRTHVVPYFNRLPFVDEVLPFASNRWLIRRRPWLAVMAVPEIAGVFRNIWSRRWDGAVQWRGQFTDTMLSVSTRASHKTAAVQRIHRPALLPVERVPGTGIELVMMTRPAVHLVEAMAAPAIRLAERLTGQPAQLPDLRLHFPIAAAEQAAADRLLASHGLGPRSYAVLSISSKTVHNQWPIDRFAAVARHLQERHGLDVLVDALPQDRAKAIAVVAGLPGRAVAPEGTGLGEAAAVIAQARMLVCYNSAPMHIASALGTPVVVLGGRDGADIAPWRVPNRVVTGNEFYPRRHPDVRLWSQLTARVTAEAVCAATDELLAETSTPLHE